VCVDASRMTAACEDYAEQGVSKQGGEERRTWAGEDKDVGIFRGMPNQDNVVDVRLGWSSSEVLRE
jgi:hypothetical protein